MRGFFRKRLACLLCVALLAGWLPVDSAKADDGGSVQKIYIVGQIVGNNEVQLRVDEGKLEGVHAADLDYVWLAGTDEEHMVEIHTTSFYSLMPEASLPKPGCLKVQAQKKDTKEVVACSETKRISAKSMEVDLLCSVEAHPVSASGKNDGRITGTSPDMECISLSGGNQSYPCGMGEITGLAEGRYRLQYKSTVCGGTIFSEGIVATYTIGANDAAQPTETPMVTTMPTKVPDSTVEPTKVPNNTTEPTEVPGNTTVPTKVPSKPTEPTKVPEITTGPEEVPDNTAEPTKVPGQTGEPTKAPSSSAEPSPADMTKPGVTATVGNVIYKSNGSGSVSYDGIKSDKKTVSVPDKVTIGGKSYPVTTISSGAFSGSKVQNVKLGKNVKVIGKKAFKNCKSLKKVTFSNKTTTVSAESFSGCAKLGSVSLPASVKTVGAKAFKNCKKLKKFKLGKSPVKTKKGKVMFGATGGKKVAIGASALENCLNLRSVIINSQVTKIGNNTFKNCKKLASMLVKSLKLRTVGNRALKGVSRCKISVPAIRLKKYRTLFTNKGQGKKVVIAKV